MFNIGKNINMKKKAKKSNIRNEIFTEGFNSRLTLQK